MSELLSTERAAERISNNSYFMNGHRFRWARASFDGVGAAIIVLAISACSSESAAPTGSLSSTQPEWQLDSLTAEEGISIRIPSFEVAPGHEEQSCYFLRVPELGVGDIWVNRVQLAMNKGSHHMNIFRVRTIVELDPNLGEPIQLGPYPATLIRGHDDYAHSPCWGSANWADWPLVANTEIPNPPDWQLPEGVAMRFTPGEMLMVQTHYVNTTTQPTVSGYGSVGINFKRTAEESPQELGTLFATQQNIRICQSNPQPTFSGTCKFPGAVTITAANGHFHSRGHEFRMYSWDGKSVSHPSDPGEFYVSEHWNDPPMITDINRPVSDGGGIWWDCEYQWRAPAVFSCADVNAKDKEGAGDCCYTFGGNTDVGEHCNVFLYYYPKLESSTDVFCN
jgi:hypothetical protein